jgi:TRAP-type C4-dicarboxylate transport system substrate-binding protein
MEENMRRAILNKFVNSAKPAALAVILAVSFAPIQAVAEQIVARMSGHWSPKHQSSIHAQMFADEVTKRSNGRLKIEYYPSKQLFGIREVLGAVTSGAVELGGVVGVVSFPPINKNFNVASYPGLFSSYEQQRGFFLKSTKGKEIWNDITSKSNSQLIMYNPVGPVMTFSSARELTGIDVMKGLKARRLLKSELPMWKALEANAVSLPTGEVYTSLQTGMIDTINSPPGSIEAYSWWEFLSYGQKPYQYFADAYIMANKDWMNNLPSDLQDLVQTVGAEVGQISTNTILGAGEDTLKKFIDRGGVVTELSGGEKAKFDKLMQDKVMPAMADMFDGDTLSEAQLFASK